MTTSDGYVVGTTKVVDHGPTSLRWNLVILPDGYTKNEIPFFAEDVQGFIDVLKDEPPFNEFINGTPLWNAVNIYRVDIVSTDSGADDPVSCGGTGREAATYFDASFCNNGIRRLLVVNDETVIDVAKNQTPYYHMLMVIVNSSIDGGSGGAVAVISSTKDANRVCLHEMGHTAFGLADEYNYYAGCDSGETGHDKYTDTEPSEVNVTTNTDRNTMKWKDLVLPSTAMPTTLNVNCSKCDPQPSPVSPGTVGTFEGARYFHCGLYRPEFNCMMKEMDEHYCGVCRARIKHTLAPYIP